MFFYVFYLQINVFNIYAKNGIANKQHHFKHKEGKLTATRFIASMCDKNNDTIYLVHLRF